MRMTSKHWANEGMSVKIYSTVEEKKKKLLEVSRDTERSMKHGIGELC